MTFWKENYFEVIKKFEIENRIKSILKENFKPFLDYEDSDASEKAFIF